MDNKYDTDFILYSKYKCGRCEILKQELTREGYSYTESEDYPSHIMELPVLVSRKGTEFDFVDAMRMLRTLRSLRIEDEAKANS